MSTMPDVWHVYSADPEMGLQFLGACADADYQRLHEITTHFVSKCIFIRAYDGLIVSHTVICMANGLLLDEDFYAIA